MSSENLELWNRVSESDPEYLKQVSFGSRSFTAIDPQYQIMMATKAFGAVGYGWGWDAEMVYRDTQGGDLIVLAEVTLWTGDREHTFGPFPGCRTFYNATKKRIAEDAPKMAVTDGITKCLSHLGFNADVFLGKMDGNKYHADQKQGRRTDHEDF